jgi:hypothetical protein
VADSSHEQQQLKYNKLVRANSIGADAISDMAADPGIGDGATPASLFSTPTGFICGKLGSCA